MRKYLTFIRWSSFVMMPLLMMVTQGYSKDLFETHLTVVSSSAYSTEGEGKISISDTGKVELSIKGLRSADDQLINQNSILVIDAEINDSPETYSRSFDITNGEAKLEFTLEGLNKGDKLEIINVVINKVTSPTPSPTPTATASPTPTSSPTATPVVTPTPSLAHSVSDLAILAPGGIIAESTTPTPTPTPGVINADVEIKPETINLKSHGKFKAFIKFKSGSPYDVSDIVAETVECEGAKAIDGKLDKNRFIATFNVQDMDFNAKVELLKGPKKDEKEKQELTVTGELEDGTGFEGSDTVKIRGKGKGHDDDDDDEEDEDDDDDDHGKKKHH